MKNRKRDEWIFAVLTAISALIIWLSLAQRARGAELMPVPVVTEGTNGTKATYAAVRADYTGGVVSAWSNEVVVTNRDKAVLAWDAAANPAAVYTIGYGTNSGSYSKLVSVGTNLTSPLIIPKTNRVVTVTPLQGASASGPWTLAAGCAVIVLTNPPGKAFYKWAISETNF